MTKIYLLARIGSDYITGKMQVYLISARTSDEARHLAYLDRKDEDWLDKNLTTCNVPCVEDKCVILFKVLNT